MLNGKQKQVLSTAQYWRLMWYLLLRFMGLKAKPWKKNAFYWSKVMEGSYLRIKDMFHMSLPYHNCIHKWLAVGEEMLFPHNNNKIKNC